MANSTSNSPGVFRGNARLASHQDLAILRQELQQLIAGPINELSENGYIPWKYNNDGSLDIETLFPELVSQFKESTGLTINKNGYPLYKDIKSINFLGNYISISKDEFNNLVCEIRPPKEEISRFNGTDGITDARIKIKNEIIEDMIIPDTSKLTDISVYGDWEPGTKHPGINWNKNDLYDALKLYTSDRVYASSLSSYFEVLVYDPQNRLFGSGTFVSTSINKSTPSGDKLAAASSGNSFHINIVIKDFKEDSNGYSFKPEFEINLIGIIGQAGGRFRVKIIHHDMGNHNAYVSQDLLYNVGRIPTINSPYIQIASDSSLSQNELVSFQWCSGLKYVSKGTILLSIDNIKNLNNMAATENKIEYKFNIADQELLESSFTDYDLSYDKEAKWQTYLYLNRETFNNQETSGYVIAKNAFGESEPYYITIPILLNSVSTLKKSNSLNEYFSDETYRVLHTFQGNSLGSYISLVKWNSEKDLTTYDNGKGLMIVPGKGLMYPFGDWSKFQPIGSPSYNDLSFLSNEKFYARTFSGNSNLKFGGIFQFTGLTKEEFFDDRLNIEISPDQGLNWFSLKHVRGVETIINHDDYSAEKVFGILTKINEVDGKLQISWAYPGNKAYSGELYFKLGMNKTSQFCIKSISLLNSDGTEDW